MSISLQGPIKMIAFLSLSSEDVGRQAGRQAGLWLVMMAKQLKERSAGWLAGYVFCFFYMYSGNNLIQRRYSFICILFLFAIWIIK